MFITGAQLKNLLHCDNSILQEFTDQNIGNISYDLRTRRYYDHNQSMQICELLPGSSVYVESEEIINLPNDIIGQVVLRNSRIRQGLQLAAPVYQPGHKTRVYFRLTNISASKITLNTGEELASIMFEQLGEAVESSYSGTFQNELNFRDLGNYEPQLKAEMTDLDKKVDDIKHIEKNLYSNVINLMVIFIGIFSLININVSLANSSGDIAQLLIFNLSTIGSIAFMTGILHTIMNTNPKKLSPIWIACVLAFVMAILIFLIS